MTKNNSEIHFFSEDAANPIKEKSTVKSWIQQTITAEDKEPGNITIIFCSDDYLLNMNQEHLDHDYYTDIITFQYSTQPVSGDLFISTDRTADNAKQLEHTHLSETLRVVIHGVLHLIGYGDKTAKEKKVMREKEDHYLEKIALLMPC